MGNNRRQQVGTVQSRHAYIEDELLAILNEKADHIRLVPENYDAAAGHESLATFRSAAAAGRERTGAGRGSGRSGRGGRVRTSPRLRRLSMRRPPPRRTPCGPR